ncbi:MAG: amidohydrolase family protein [Acidobacteria bacterium]|nr:amidohydrolase family protein [Acidobacteriota bacterium]
MTRLPLVLLVAGVIGFSLSLGAQQPAADLVLTNGKIITVDAQFSIAQAVAIRGDRIVAVGTSQEIARLAGPGTRRIDLRGRAVVPGFIDNHAHFQEEGAYWTLELRFDNIDSRRAALEKLRAKAQSLKPGEWVYNLGGWSPDQFADDKKPFTRDELDKYAPNNPVFLQFSRAETFLNSKAIETIGLGTMKEPWIQRDGSGRPTGVIGPAGNGPVRDAANFLDAPNGERANLPRDVIVASSLAMLRDLSSAGLTASGGDCTFEELHREFQSQGRAAMRFFCFRTAPGGRGAGALEKQLAAIPSLKYFDGDEWQDHVNWGENFVGGGGDNLYAATQEPVSQESWNTWGRFAREVVKARIQAMIHTQTEVNIEGKLQQLEQMQKEGLSVKPLRWALMHMEQVTPAQIERMKKLNMFLAVHPREIVTGGLLHRVHGDKAFGYPLLREIQDSGIMWGLGTDAFEVNQYRPFQTLYWAVTGKMIGGTVVNTHPVSREAALIAHTRSNAYLFFREADLGSIQAGHFADLVVIDRDYLTVPADQIKDIKPVLTMVGGRTVFETGAN